jgi:hypothetical protein
VDTISKPDELLALHGITEEMFTTLRRWFEVPDHVTIDLGAVDSAVEELGEPRMIAAMAMRKLQALNLLATPGVRTSTDVVVSIIQDIDRALTQAPAMRLKVAAAETDWDAALVDLSGEDGPSGPASVDDEDEEVVRFRTLHSKLHEALVAVLRASEGEIRYLL